MTSEDIVIRLRVSQFRLCAEPGLSMLEQCMHKDALAANPFAIPSTYILCTILQCNFELYSLLSGFAADGEVLRSSYQSPKPWPLQRFKATCKAIDVHTHYQPEAWAFATFDVWGPINAN